MYMFLLSFTINVVRRYPYRWMEERGRKSWRGGGGGGEKKAPQNKEIKKGGKRRENCLARTVFWGIPFFYLWGGFLRMEWILPNPHDGGEGEKKEGAFGGTGWENAPVHPSVHPGPRRETWDQHRVQFNSPLSLSLSLSFYPSFFLLSSLLCCF